MPEKDQAILNAIRRTATTPSDAIRAYEKELAIKDKQFIPKPAAPVPTQSLGKMISLHKHERGATFKMANGYLRVSYLMSDLLQIRIRPDDNFGDLIPPSDAIAQTTWTEVEPVVLEDPESVVVGAGAMACRINRADGHFAIFAPDGSPLVHNEGEGFSWTGNAVRWTRRLPDDESCYGMGQRASGLNLRGQIVPLWNFDPVLYQRHEEYVYYSIPFYVGFQSKYFLGILWDNPAKGVVDLGKTNPKQMTFDAESGELRFYLTSAITADLILDRYTLLTGRPVMPPLWALGYQQSRWGYESSTKFRELARQFRNRRIPCDVLNFDIDYMEDFRCFTWSARNFADLPHLITELHQHGFKAVAILDPGIKADPAYHAFADGQQKDVFMKYPDGSLYTGVVWAETSAFPDFSNSSVREWWANQVAEFLKKAPFDGIWNDMNEPTTFTSKGPGTFPEYLNHQADGGQLAHAEGGHNTYGMQMARSTNAGLVKANPEKRPFTLTRTGYAGVQRYASSWTGDNLSTWDHLRLSIPMLMNLGLSGMPFSGPDIGGFGGDADAELYTRWIQLGSMLPYFRTHTIQGSKEQEPWSFGATYENIIRRYIELRYQLMPYFYSVIASSHHQGLPFIRPGFFHDRTDPELRTQDDAFFVGDCLFVAPILEPGATQRNVYLPRGAWYDFWTNRLIDGAQHITVQAPLDFMPMFFRAGRVLPMWHTQQFVGESKLDEVILRVYAGLGETTIYEDAGEGLGYQKGEYRFSYFTASFFPNGQFGIDWRVAGNYKPAYEKTRVEFVGIPGEPQEITVDKRPAPLWFFENGILEILCPPFKELRLVGRRPDTSQAAQTVIRKPPR